MLLAIDIGNTSISFGVFDISNIVDRSSLSDKLLFSSEISSTVSRSCDELSAAFSQIFSLYGHTIDIIDSVAVVSVVPHITNTVYNSIEKLFMIKPFIIAPGIRTGFKIGIDDPATLGGDIVANIAAAIDLLKAPIVVFDAGTANTLTFVNSDNTVVGTSISPGLRISLDALTEKAELLQSIKIDGSNIPLMGKNTDESIASGVILGNAMMIDAFTRNIRETYLDKNHSEKLSLISTGEFSEVICANTRNKFTYKKDLTLCGIASLYIRNVLHIQ